MDDRVRQELAAWLKFYRDLGIEDFYRRAPGSASPVSPRAEVPPPAAQAEAAQASAETARRVGAPISSGGPPARSLSLFEAPPPPRREHETLEQVRWKTWAIASAAGWRRGARRLCSGKGIRTPS